MLVTSLVQQQLQNLAFDLGFPMVGFVNSQPSPGFERLQEWIKRGYMGTMSYIPNRKDAYRDPSSVLPNCKSIMMLAFPYANLDDSNKTMDRRSRPDSCEGRVGRYAVGSIDYHELIREKLNKLCSSLDKWLPGSVQRGVVDTAPLMERDFAQIAGLGWIGKNTLLLNRKLGSYFFLAALLTTIDFEASLPFESDHCGTCTACLDACPTSAFVQPRVLDASRCISYLTIEYRGSIDRSLSSKMDNWIFGCDVCQSVCPWNRKVNSNVDSQLLPMEMETKLSLSSWLQMTEGEFRGKYRHTPFWRTRLIGMQRNAMIAAANSDRRDLIPLIESFRNHADDSLRQTCEVCLERLLP